MTEFPDFPDLPTKLEQEVPAQISFGGTIETFQTYPLSYFGSMALESAKGMFLELLLKGAKARAGVEDRLIPFLEQSDFFVAPAAANPEYHGSYAGGLCKHSILTLLRLESLVEAFHMREMIPEESRALVALCHDLCKINFYRPATKWHKPNGKWESYQGYEIVDSFPFGHGEKSVALLLQHIRLTKEEALAIRWHMGGFDDAARAYAGGLQLNQAWEKTPLAILLHMADTFTNHIDKV